MILALGLTLTALVTLAVPTPLAFADTTVTVTPSAMNGWWFYDDGNPGGIGNLVTGPGTPPLGTGSVQLATPLATARENITTQNFAGTRFSNITNLQYSTYRSSVDGGNNLAITLQFDTDYDLNDTTTTWQGRVVFEPYMTSPGGVPQNTWQSWTPMTGNWWMSSASPIVNNAVTTQHCPQATPCSWTQLKAYYPNAGIRRTNGWVHLKAGGPSAGFDGNADALTIGVSGNNTTYDFEPGTTGLAFVNDVSYVGVGGNVIVAFHINSVANLYGYQFQVNYDQTKATATGAFVNTWFNAAPGAAPAPWNGTCDNGTGTCKFASTLLSPAPALSGSGAVAYMTFTGVSPGTVNLSFIDNILTDKDANSLTHTIGTGTLNVYGTATISGIVALQGRATPIDSGTVTVADQGGLFPVQVITFNAGTGAWTATVGALGGGTSYDLLASHSVYLSNQKIGVSVTPGSSVTPTPDPTILKGGDANNDGTISVADLSCIGAAFGGPPTVCGLTGSSDINGVPPVNILDLVLAGGNYGLSSPRPW